MRRRLSSPALAGEGDRVSGGGGRRALILFACALLGASPALADAALRGPVAEVRGTTASDEVQIAQTVRTYNLTLPLIFQGAYLGDVPVAASPDGHIAVNVERFIGLLGERLSPEMTAALKLLSGGQQIVAIEAFQPAGIVIAYDTAKLELRVTIPVDQQGGQSLSAVDETDRGRPTLVTIDPAVVAASLTMTARQAYVWSPSSSQGWDPFRVSADFAGNIFGHEGLYFFAQGEYDEAASDPFHRGNAVLMYDDTDNALRYSAGDVTPVPAGFQSSPILGGLSFQRQYGELQPFRNVRPSGLFRFSLDRAATVDVVVNGTVIRTLRLEAGQYDLKDFPLFNGLNDVELYVVDEYGRRLIAAFSQFFSAKLLSPGIWEFGATAGLPQIRDETGDGLQYDDNNATFSAYARYGLLDDITVGGNFQMDQLQWLAGAELGWATPIGTLGVVTGWSDIDGALSGHSYLVSYEASAEEIGFFRNPQVNLSYLYTSESFASVGTPVPDEPVEYELRGRFSTQLPYDFGLGVSASFTQGRDLEPNEARYGISVSRNLGFADVTASNERTERNGELDDNRFLLSLSIPLSDRENVRASYDSQNDQYQAEYLRFQRNELGDYGVRASVLRDNDRLTGTGEFAYNANRFAALLQHDAIADNAMSEIQSQRTSYTLGTQLAFADGDIAVGRPVGQRFAIVRAHETLEGSAVGVTQNKGSKSREAETDFFGPALVSAGGSYQPQSVYVDVEDLPAGYNVGTGQYDLFPGPASGYAVTVGSDASHVVMGNLLATDGKPLSLLGGEVRAVGREGFKPVLVFTNSGGRFFAEGLAPGKYQMVLGPALDIVVDIEVPDGSKGVIDVGTITVKEKGN